MTCTLCAHPITTVHQSIPHAGQCFPVCEECFPGVLSPGGGNYTSVPSIDAIERLHWAVEAKVLAERQEKKEAT